MQVNLDEFDPVQVFKNEKWSWFDEYAQVQVSVLSTDDLSFVTHLADGETEISGEERFRRIISNNQIPVGPAIFHALSKNRRGFPKTFRTRKNEEGKVQRFFCPGAFLQDPNGKKREFYFWLDESGNYLYHALPMDVPRTSRDLSIVLRVPERPDFAYGGGRRNFKNSSIF